MDVWFDSHGQILVGGSKTKTKRRSKGQQPSKKQKSKSKKRSTEKNDALDEDEFEDLEPIAQQEEEEEEVEVQYLVLDLFFSTCPSFSQEFLQQHTYFQSMSPECEEALNQWVFLILKELHNFLEVFPLHRDTFNYTLEVLADMTRFKEQSEKEPKKRG